MPKRTALRTVIALSVILLLAGCFPPPPTNGAGQPVDSHTGVPQGGSASPD